MTSGWQQIGHYHCLSKHVGIDDFGDMNEEDLVIN